MNRIITELYHFWKNPVGFNSNKIIGKRNVIVYFVSLFFSFLVIQFIYGFIISTIEIFFRVDINISNLSEDYITSKFNLAFYYFLLLLLGPFLEEVVFRLGLSFKRRDIIVSISFLSLFFLYKEYWYISLLLCTIIIVLLKNSNFDIIVNNSKELYRNSFIYIISFAFVVLHFSNFSDYNSISWYVYVAYFFSLFWGVLFLVFVRFRLGFIWCVILHILVNSIGFLGTFISRIFSYS